MIVHFFGFFHNFSFHTASKGKILTIEMIDFSRRKPNFDFAVEFVDIKSSMLKLGSRAEM